ncbi:MAG: septum formation initiator family protein [Desulfobacterium sp.]|nr:septum formation initiator family protein [Desulfobacterium sp.]
MGAIGFMIVYSENGFNDWRGLCKDVQRIEAVNQELELANRELARTIERLKTDMDYIEHVARHELGMAADNEIVFRFKERSGSETL